MSATVMSEQIPLPFGQLFFYRGICSALVEQQEHSLDVYNALDLYRLPLRSSVCRDCGVHCTDSGHTQGTHSVSNG